MSILKWFLDALDGDPDEPKPEQPEITIDIVKLVSERRALIVERDCYKAELKRYGATDTSLRNRVKLYTQGLRADVIGQKAS